MKDAGDYISREAAIENICGRLKMTHPSGIEYSNADVRAFVAALISPIPAADVRPVVRGKWMPIIEGNEYGETYQTGCYCSECGEVLQHEPYFCPNCGADMRGEQDV